MENLETILNSIESEKKQNTWNQYMRYFRRWPWFLIFCFVGLVAGLVIYKFTPEKYRVESKLLIFKTNTTLSSNLSFEEYDRYDRSNIEDQIGILQSYTIFSRALNNLNWDYSWYIKDKLTMVELYKNDPFKIVLPANSNNLKGILIEITPLNTEEYSIVVDGEARINGIRTKISIQEQGSFKQPLKNEYFNFILTNKNAQIGETYYLVFNNIVSQTRSYLNRVSVDVSDEESELVYLSLTGFNPKKEADFLNELTQVFIEYGIELKSSKSETSADLIESQSEEIKESLKEAEDKYNSFRQRNQAVDLDQEANLIYHKLEEIENEQYLLQQKLEYFRTLLDNLTNSALLEQIGNPTVSGITDAGLRTTLTELLELYSREKILSVTVQKKSPNYIRLEQEISIKREILEQTLKNLIQTTEREKSNLDERHRQTQMRLASMPSTERNLVEMQREYDLNSELYNFIQQKKAEASISKASIAPQAKIIDPAMVETASKVWPNLFIFIFAGLVIGFLIPFSLITFKNIFNTRIESTEEIEQNCNIPVLDGIAHHNYRDNLPIVKYPHSGIAESFRALRINIQNSPHLDNPKVISVNSLLPGEGKSFISSNLASVFATSNKNVLLIGADLRKPKLDAFIKNDTKTGLSTYLKGDNSFEEIVLSTSVPNLFFIQSGPIPPNPSDLLENPKFKELIDKARNTFDYIVLDNAPILLVPDAVWTSKISDVNLFLVRLNYSRKDQLKQINKLIKINNIQNAYVVVNDTPHKGYGYGKRYWKNGYGKYKAMETES